MRHVLRFTWVYPIAVLAMFEACSASDATATGQSANDGDAGKLPEREAGTSLEGGPIVEEGPDASIEAGPVTPTMLGAVVGLRTIVREGTRVYYSNGVSLGYVEATGGAPVTILGGLNKMTGALTVRDGYLYFSDSTAADKFAVERVAIAGTGRKLLANWFYSWEIGVLGPNAYLWNPCFTTNALCSGKGAGIVRIPADGTAGGTFLTSTTGNVNHLVHDDELAVFAEDATIRSIALAGGTPKQIALDTAYSLALASDGYVYWTSNDEEKNQATVLRAQANGSTAVPEVLVTETGYFSKVVVDGNDVYWLARPKLLDLDSIKHLTVGNKKSDVFFQSPAGRSAMSIALDATYVYYATGDGIYRLPR